MNVNLNSRNGWFEGLASYNAGGSDLDSKSALHFLISKSYVLRNSFENESAFIHREFIKRKKNKKRQDTFRSVESS